MSEVVNDVSSIGRDYGATYGTAALASTLTNGMVTSAAAKAAASDGAWWSWTGDALCDLSKEVQKVQSELKETINNGFAMQAMRQATDTLNLNNRLCESEKAAIRAEYESKLAVQAAIKEVNANVDAKTERLSDKVEHNHEELSEAIEECCCENKQLLSAFERRVDEKFFHAREEDLEREVEEAERSSQTAEIVAAIIAKLGLKV